MDSLRGAFTWFTVFQDPFASDVTSALAVAPAYVIEDERRRWGLIQPLHHPYVFVAAIIAFIAATAIVFYALFAVEFAVLPHIVRIHR